MSLIQKFPAFGNLRTYDVRKFTSKLEPDFAVLKKDKYVPQGFRYKHIIRFEIDRKDNTSSVVSLPHAALMQSSDVNPTHGNIIRYYPMYNSLSPYNVLNIINVFNDNTPRSDYKRILLQAQRITCDPNLEGLPSVENWHRDGVEHIGIVCVARHNIEGGTNEFMVNDTKEYMAYDLLPGEMVIFNDNNVRHRVSPIRPADKYKNGYRDVLLIAYPACEKAYLSNDFYDLQKGHSGITQIGF